MIPPRRLSRSPVRTIVLLSLLASTAVSIAPGSESGAAVGPSRPNVILVLTDDQRWDTLDAMPQVRTLLQERGTYFPNAFVPNSLCCPSRASILTGTHSHTNGVYGNGPPFGGFDVFHDRTTIATAMQDAGYRTMLVGKYLNGYPEGHLEYVPPGWDEWFATAGGVYYDWQAADNGAPSRVYGSRPADYSGRVLTSRALFDMRTTPPDQPFFMLFAPTAPHGTRGGSTLDPGDRAPTPDPRDVGAFRKVAPFRPPSFGLFDPMIGKPEYIRDGRWTTEDRRYADLFRQRQLESLLGVDRSIARLVEAAPEDTVVIYMSDNGFLWGEHRRLNKQVPYEEAIRIPLIVAGPGVPAGVDTRLALNIDVTTTIAAIGGIDAGTVPLGTDRSGKPILSEGLDLLGATTRESFVLEHWDGDPKVPGYCGVRTSRFTYVRYFDPRFHVDDLGFEELYDLAADPFQLTNLAADGDHAGVVAAMRGETQALCDPVPPDYRW